METFEDGFRIYTHPVPTRGRFWVSVTDMRGADYGRYVVRAKDHEWQAKVNEAKDIIIKWHKSKGID